MTTVNPPHLFITASTHPGMSGKNNEDRHIFKIYQIGADHSLPASLAIVSDGIGGHRAGEIAAQIAVEEISGFIENGDISTPVQTLREAIARASQSIHAQAENDFEKRGMGATCACAWIIGDKLYIAYVGDSRIYLIRKSSIIQLSKDHTWIQDALDAGVLNTEQAQRHPNAHVIRRYLGSTQPVEPDTRLYLAPNETDATAESNQGFSLTPGDQIILCSDGLTDLVHQDEIRATFASLDQKQALGKLTDLANRRGGHDNITIVALRVPDVVPSEAPERAIQSDKRPSRRSSYLWKACLVIFVLFSITILSILGGYIYLKHIFPISSSPTLSLTSIPARETITPGDTPMLSVSPSLSQTSTYPPTATSPTRRQDSQTVQVTLTAWPTNTPAP
jgi:serine/threonine protein phosphatase PrpC